ncbi:hypothetical protein C0J26_18020 [Pseudomonas baetica]|nr:hypothetical protein C0J26_18020 [Pseudomonas baetica]
MLHSAPATARIELLADCSSYGADSMSIDRTAQLKTLQLHDMTTAWRELLAEAPRHHQPLRHSRNRQ